MHQYIKCNHQIHDKYVWYVRYILTTCTKQSHMSKKQNQQPCGTFATPLSPFSVKLLILSNISNYVLLTSLVSLFCLHNVSLVYCLHLFPAKCKYATKLTFDFIVMIYVTIDPLPSIQSNIHTELVFGIFTHGNVVNAWYLCDSRGYNGWNKYWWNQTNICHVKWL